MDGVIEIAGLVKRFDNKVAVDGLDLSIYVGEFFGLLGPNGAGKTTMIRCVSTLTGYDEGTIRVCGLDLKEHPTEAKEHMGVIQQHISLDKDLTIRENMIAHGMYHMMGRVERDKRIAELTEFFGLGEYLDKPVDSLSGGWKKRAAIVCAMLHRPKVLFLDEPTSGLDINARRLLWDVLRRLHGSGTTIILTTHYIEEAEALCDRVGIIDRGRIIALDTPKALCEGVGRMTVEYSIDGRRRYEYCRSREEANVLTSGITDTDVLVRRTNLEDVFVELTGKSVGAQR